MESYRYLPLEKYTVGWVCALPLELHAAQAMLDERHQDPPHQPHETNIYCLGRIGEHNVVVVSLPAGRYGTNSAAACVAQMMEKFRSIKYGLLVGIAGGVPSDDADVRLGDVVISQPRGQYGGVVQYDLGKIEAGGRNHRTGYLAPPPTILLNALAKFQALGMDQSSQVLADFRMAGGIRKPNSDTLYESPYDHVGGATCRDCDPSKVKLRRDRAEEICIHYGVVASGNQVVKDGGTRDKFSRELGGVLCFEMEAAGVVNTLPCLVIRGICDYCDSHKNKQWQDYAAIVAALCAKSLFNVLPPAQDIRVMDVNPYFEGMFMTDPLIDRTSLITAKGTRVDGTCEWVCESESYTSWLGPHGAPFLWICGGPGKGKTMLSIYLSEELERYTKSFGGGGDILLYFCSQDDEKRRTATAVLRGLIYQVIKKKPWLFRHAQHFFETQEKADYTLSSTEALWTIFRGIAQDPDIGAMYCVFDGLDECDQESVEFLSVKFSQLFAHGESRSRSSKFRLVVVSREIHSLKGFPTIHLDLDFDEQVNNDIQRFVHSRVQELYRVNGFTSTIAEHVKTTLLQRSEGTFLWIGFAVNELLQRTTCTGLLDTLESIPKGLPSIYDRILLQSDQQQRQVCSLILIWVALAFRPLTVHELADAINIHTPRGVGQEQAMLDQVAICKPLLRAQNDEIHLIHQSAREYLLRDEHDENPILETFRIRPEEGHFRITQKCLDVIEINYSHQHKSDSPNPSSILKYAIRNWPAHARNAGKYSDEIFNMPRLIFQKDSYVLSSWFKDYADRDRVSHRITTLHIASMCGLNPWIWKLLTQKLWGYPTKHYINKCDRSGYSALTWSVVKGHDSTAQLLLENGARVNPRKGTNPMAVAIRVGHESMVRLLLKHGADINFVDKDDSTPLTIACFFRHLEMVQLLVRLGANINLVEHNSDVRGAVQSAISGGNVDILEFLLKSGAKLDIRDGSGLPPLTYAASIGKPNMARVLFSYGADPHCLAILGATPMHWIGPNEPEEMVRVLLQHGADINHPDKKGYTPLVYAVWWGKAPVVKALLDHGANIFAETKYGGTASEIAAEEGHDEIVEMLRAHEKRLREASDTADL